MSRRKTIQDELNLINFFLRCNLLLYWLFNWSVGNAPLGWNGVRIAVKASHQALFEQLLNLIFGGNYEDQFRWRRIHVSL